MIIINIVNEVNNENVISLKRIAPVEWDVDNIEQQLISCMYNMHVMHVNK